MNSDLSAQFSEQVIKACADESPLRIIAGNSKAFYGNTVTGDTLNVSGHTGVVSYEPTELVITARAGTPLSSIRELLHDNGQMLAFEPPAFGDKATIGGTIACNLSGPRRAYTGAARDFLLGCKIINGKGEILSFGGEVMKNVAGYDVSRLMAGAMGTLGVLLEVSLKVLPEAESEKTQLLQCSPSEALRKIHAWSQTPLPISASSYHDSTLRIRLSGAEKAVNAAIDTIGGDRVENAKIYWHQLREQQLDFFKREMPLWRLSLASNIEPTAIIEDDGNCLYEWGGALRWLTSDAPADVIQDAAAALGGHAILFRHPERCSLFQPLHAGLLRIHKNLKQAFDPKHILNPGRIYPEL